MSIRYPYSTIKLRRDISSNWSSLDPVLASGEPGVEIDTNKLKIGDGSLSWNSLGYIAGGAGGDLGNYFNTNLISGSGLNFTYSSGNNSLTINSSGVVSNPIGINGADAISNIVSLSQAEYDAIVTKDPNTLYVIV